MLLGVFHATLPFWTEASCWEDIKALMFSPNVCIEAVGMWELFCSAYIKCNQLHNAYNAEKGETKPI